MSSFHSIEHDPEQVNFVIKDDKDQPLYAGVKVPDMDPAVWSLLTGAVLQDQDWKWFAIHLIGCLLEASENHTPTNPDLEQLGTTFRKALKHGYDLGVCGNAGRLHFLLSQGSAVREIVERLAP